MFEKLQSILSSVKADYADIRYEKRHDVMVGFNDHELTVLTSSTTDGYVLRVLSKGGMSSTAFTFLADAPQAVKMAASSAEEMGKRRKTPIVLAQAEPVKDHYTPFLKEDPRQVSLEEKIELMREYLAIPLSNEKIVNTNLSNLDLIREKWYMNTEGSEIREDLITSILVGSIRSREGNLIQNIRFSAGGSDGFQNIRNQNQYFEERSKLAVDLLSAEPVSADRYNCILDPQLAAVFTHEAFGHFSEADIVESLPELRGKMQIGAKLGSDILNIVDDSTQRGILGHYKYDDEGVAVRKVRLMNNGVLSGRLHSRRTAYEFGEPVSGHNIAEDFRYAPIVRMGNIYIEAGEDDLNSLLAKLDNGLILVNAAGGQTAGENFTFGAGYGYKVENGKIGKMIRDINVSGDLYQSLLNISAIGDKVEFQKAGGCGKGQLNARSGMGAPHVLVNNLMVGGK